MSEKAGCDTNEIYFTPEKTIDLVSGYNNWFFICDFGGKHFIDASCFFENRSFYSVFGGAFYGNFSYLCDWSRGT